MLYFFIEKHMENQINAGDQNNQQINLTTRREPYNPSG